MNNAHTTRAGVPRPHQLRKVLPAVAVLLLLAARGDAAQVYRVSLDGHAVPPYDTWERAFTNLADAVAAVPAGATLLVSNGVYCGGEVIVDKPLTIRPAFGAHSVAIDGELLRRCLSVLADARIEDLVLTNGYAALDVSPPAVGGGAYLTDGVLTNCVITRNRAYLQGGGVYCAGGGTLHDCMIERNYAYDVGGGAVCDAGGLLLNCTVTNNASGNYGGGVMCMAGGRIETSAIVANRSDYGGGLCGYYGATIIATTLAANRTTYDGGGLYAYGGGPDAVVAERCTLSGNAAGRHGGGAYCDGAGALRRCVITGNTAAENGGGSCLADTNGTVEACAVHANLAGENGGGIYAYGADAVRHCTITGNRADGRGGGLDATRLAGRLRNSIVRYNRAPDFADMIGSGSVWAETCCLPFAAGDENTVTNPPLLVSPARLSTASPCVGAGTPNAGTDADIDGEAWAPRPAIGCDQPPPAGGATGTLSVAITAEGARAVPGHAVAFVGHVNGSAEATTWNFGDGTAATNSAYVEHAWSEPARHRVVLTAFNMSHPGGVSATAAVEVVASADACTVYAWTNSPRSLPPYSSWATAAHTLQAAVDAQDVLGGLVLATNGTYGAGGATTPLGSVSNRVVIPESITVRSTSGASLTHLVGAPGVRGAFVEGTLQGFTIRDGRTRTYGHETRDRSGGGAYVNHGTVENCVFTNNWANLYGGGVHASDDGVVRDCTVVGNSADSCGGGAHHGQLDRCRLGGNAAASGGGAYNAMLSDCVLTGNTATAYGGGAYSGSMTACTLANNAAASGGGGAYFGGLRNCVVVGNTSGAQGGGGYFGSAQECTVANNRANGYGGGWYYGSHRNSIVYNNRADGDSANLYNPQTVDHCCTIPAIGEGVVTNAPLFVNTNAANYRLSAGSPCIDAGRAGAGSTADREGMPRPLDGDGDGISATDIGANEFVNPAIDTDGDGCRDARELTADTDPRDARSVLAVTTVRVFRTDDGRDLVTIGWCGGRRVTQQVEAATSLTHAAWFPVTTVTPPTPTNNWFEYLREPGPPGFYRVRTEP